MRPTVGLISNAIVQSYVIELDLATIYEWNGRTKADILHSIAVQLTVHRELDDLANLEHFFI